MIHNWDQQIVRLRHRVEELEAQNKELRALLKDAVHICDEAIAAGREPAAPSRFANTYRTLLFHLARSIRRIEALWRLACEGGRVDGGGFEERFGTRWRLKRRARAAPAASIMGLAS